MFSERDKDDFWDIEKLVPKKRHSILAPFSTKEKVATVKINSDADTDQVKNGNTRLTLNLDESKKDEKSEKYELSYGLIRSVTIRKIVDKYDFYGNFRKSALLYYEVKTGKCDFVPFFSYMPQYSQFNQAQKEYYFYWRDLARRGKFIKTDYSYFYLYVYEILNLPDMIPSERGLEMLITLWRAYREELRNIDSNMSLWVQDYCLVHRLKCPMDKIKDFIFDVITAAEFKEFYLCDIGKMGNDGVGAIVACLSDYDWRRGKYAGGENKDVYCTHLLGAMRLLISELWSSGEIFNNSDLESAKITRSAFRGSLCTHSVKCKLEIEYLPLSKADGLRNAVTAALKYTENKLRALLGIKSRLAIRDLPDQFKLVIDRYFISVFDKVNKERARANMPEYERMYETVESGLSIDGADEIERASWSTTLRLVKDSDDELEIITDKKDEDIQENTEQNTVVQKETYGLSDGYISYIGLLLQGRREEARALSERLGVMELEMVSEINETFSDGFGDVIIEENDEGYVIIEDYREDIEEWLTK